MMDAKTVDVTMLKAFISHFLEIEKVDSLLTHLEEDMFKGVADSEILAIITCSACIAGLMPNRDLAIKILNTIYDIGDEIGEGNEDTASHTQH